MKKLFLITLICIAINAFSQTKTWVLEQQIVGGRNWFSQSSLMESHFMFQAGADIVRQYRNLGVGVGIGYSAESETEKYPNNKIVTRMHYIRIPVFLRVTSNETRVRPFADVGLSFGVFMAGTRKTKSPGKPTRTDNAYPVNDPDMGFLGNAGIINKINDRMNFLTFITYYYGIAQQKLVTCSSNTPPIAYRNIGVGLGLKYKLSTKTKK